MTLATRQLAWADNGDGTYTATHAVAIDGDDESSHFGLPPYTIAVGVQLTGTVDSGTYSIQGSNDNLTFAALPTAVAFTAVGLKALATSDLGYKYYRCFAASGGGSASVNFIIHVRTDRA